MLGVEEIIRFDDDGLNEAARYLQRHRPDKFLGCLRIWTEHGHDFSEELIEELHEEGVLCRGNRSVPLENVYFPVPTLESRVARFVEPGAFFPWLWLDTEAIPSVWEGLLTKLKFGSPSTDLEFALDMLNYTLDAFPDTITSTHRTRLFDLYDYIHIKYSENKGRETRKRIR